MLCYNDLFLTLTLVIFQGRDFLTYICASNAQHSAWNRAGTQVFTELQTFLLLEESITTQFNKYWSFS